MVDKKYEGYVADNLNEFAKEVIRLASQKSVSARNDGVEECAVLVEKMLAETGAKTKVLKMEGVAPLVYGEIGSSRSSKTILFYNH